MLCRVDTTQQSIFSGDDQAGIAEVTTTRSGRVSQRRKKPPVSRVTKVNQPPSRTRKRKSDGVEFIVKKPAPLKDSDPVLPGKYVKRSNTQRRLDAQEVRYVHKAVQMLAPTPPFLLPRYAQIFRDCPYDGSPCPWDYAEMCAGKPDGRFQSLYSLRPKGLIASDWLDGCAWEYIQTRKDNVFVVPSEWLQG